MTPSTCACEHVCVSFLLYVGFCVTLVCLCHPSADIWGDGDLPPGWREISDSSEVYFWHVPTGTTQYHRPVAPGNQHASSNIEPDAEQTESDPNQEMKDTLKLPNEVRGPTNLVKYYFIFNFTGTKQVQLALVFFKLKLCMSTLSITNNVFSYLYHRTLFT